MLSQGYIARNMLLKMKMLLDASNARLLSTRRCERFRKAGQQVVNIRAGQRTLVVHNVGAKGFGGLVNNGAGQRTLVVHNVGAKGFGGLVNIGAGQRTLVVHNVGAKGFGGLVIGTGFGGAGQHFGAGQRTLVVHNVGAKGFGGGAGRSTLRLVNTRLSSRTSVRKALGGGGLVNIGAGQRTLVVHNVGAKGFGGAGQHWGWSTLVVHNVGAKGFGRGWSTLRLVNTRLLSRTSVRKALGGRWSTLGLGGAGQHLGWSTHACCPQSRCERLWG